MDTLWNFQVIETDLRTVVRGVILAGTPPKLSASPFQNGLQVLRTYFVKVRKNAEVTLRWVDGGLNCLTDDNGQFIASIDARSLSDISVLVAGKELKPNGKYPTYFANPKKQVGVISDIDDTVIESYTARNLKRISTTLFTTTEQRKPVVYIQSLFDRVRDFAWPVFYVSKSESNLYGVLTSVFVKLGFPEGPLLLTPYLSFRGLLKGKPSEHKIHQIRWLMQEFPQQRFLLLGDDSQRDMQVYLRAINEFPGRILHVFIRHTALRTSVKKSEAFRDLKASGVPVVYFRDEEDPSDSIARVGVYSTS